MRCYESSNKKGEAMRVVTVATTVMALLGLVVFASGCSQEGVTDAAPVQISGPPPDADHAGHNHGNEHQGPHHGHVIELGRSHEYHAELVDDEATGTVTAYILDKDLKELAIDATSITMNLMIDDQSKTFELAAATDGQASRFDPQGKALFEALHSHEATGKIRVTINGTPYSGDVEHHDHHDDDGDHDGHNHG